MKAFSNFESQTFAASQFSFAFLQQTFLFQQTQGTFTTFGFARQAAFKDFEDLAGMNNA